jgi:hypothetical protein
VARPHSLLSDTRLPAIAAALRAGRSVREVAAGFSKSTSAVDRSARALRQADADAARLPALLLPGGAANGTGGGNGTPAPVRSARVKGLRIYGGKARLAERIAAHLPPHDLYCEPWTACCTPQVGHTRSPADTDASVEA